MQDEASGMIRNGNLNEELATHADVSNSVLHGLEARFAKILVQLPQGISVDELNLKLKEKEICKKLEKQIEEDHVAVIELQKLKTEKEQKIKVLTETLKDQQLKEEADKAEEEEHNKSSNAYKIAIVHYQNLFGYKIVIKEQNESLLAVLTFTIDKLKFPIMFTLNDNIDKILDFDASSVCGLRQEKMLKERFNKTKNTQALLCTLRKICMKKAQAS